MDNRPRRDWFANREGRATGDRPPAHPARCRIAIDAFSSTAWAPAFTAIAGASAALTGLLFVAISINLGEVIKVPGLVPRAIEVLILLTAVLVLSTLLLMPAQNTGTLAAEVLSVTVLADALVTSIHIRASRHLVNVTPRQFALRVFGAQVGLVFLLLGGVTLIAQAGGGLYWVVPGMLAAMVAAIIGAWVLLVEIVR